MIRANSVLKKWSSNCYNYYKEKNILKQNTWFTILLIKKL